MKWLDEEGWLKASNTPPAMGQGRMPPTGSPIAISEKTYHVRQDCVKPLWCKFLEDCRVELSCICLQQLDTLVAEARGQHHRLYVYAPVGQQGEGG